MAQLTGSKYEISPYEIYIIQFRCIQARANNIQYFEQFVSIADINLVPRKQEPLLYGGGTKDKDRLTRVGFCSSSSVASRRVTYVMLLLLDRSHGLFGGIVQIVSIDEFEATLVEQLLAQLDIGSFQAHHHGNGQRQ